MPRRKNRTALVLLPQAPSQAHVALLEHMAQGLQFELVYPAPGSDRATSILQASFVLADVSGNDPQVLYWLGVAHTFGKRVFLVADTLERLAYDLASNRTWIVDPASDNRDIHQAMAQFLAVPFAMGPVRLFLGKFAFFGENLIGWRFLAFWVDVLLLLPLLLLALHLAIPGDQSFGVERATAIARALIEGSGSQIWQAAEPVAVSAFYLVFAYFVLTTWLLRATVGQLVTGLRVVQTDHRRVTFGQCVGRSLLSVLVIMTYGAAFLSAIRGPAYQAVHDVLSGTIVVRRHAF